jgi:hypothetical protein
MLLALHRQTYPQTRATSNGRPRRGDLHLTLHLREPRAGENNENYTFCNEMVAMAAWGLQCF